MLLVINAVTSIYLSFLKLTGGVPMKKLLASASILVLGSVAASAADFPLKAAPMVAPIPVFSWTGCYVGLHAGGGTMTDSNTHDAVNPVFGGLSVIEFGANGNNGIGTGGVAGGQGGCNYQDGNAVFGLEAEGYWSGLRTTTGFTLPTEGLSFTQTAKNKSDFSIAARVGIAFDRTLVYGKAGWVWGNFDFGSAFTECINCGSIAFAQSGTLNGLLLGLGIEHAFARNWTVKLEYNHLQFGSKSLSAAAFEDGFAIPQLSSSFTQHATKDIVKVGFNYLFNWGAAPVLAKY
jgi:outer membrane immunogenic protein